jgi:hypothetical protein
MDHVVVVPILVELVVHLDTQLEAVEDLRHGVVSAHEEDRVRVVTLLMLLVHYLVLIQVGLWEHGMLAVHL